MWGTKLDKARKPRVLCLCFVEFSACMCQKKSVVYETECGRVAVQRGNQDQNRLWH